MAPRPSSRRIVYPAIFFAGSVRGAGDAPKESAWVRAPPAAVGAAPSDPAAWVAPALLPVSAWR